VVRWFYRRRQCHHAGAGHLLVVRAGGRAVEHNVRTGQAQRQRWEVRSPVAKVAIEVAVERQHGEKEEEKKDDIH
jgi:hypothetical protein